MRPDMHEAAPWPPKFARLRDLAGEAAVPRLTCLATRDLQDMLEGFAEARDGCDAILRRIALTAASRLTEDLAEIDDLLRRVRWNAAGSARLEAAMAALADPAATPAGHWPGPLAVRSANAVEDRSGHSFAGVFETVLDVRDEEGLRAAILEVWRSAYAPAAVLERLHAGLLEQRTEMGVILQRMVEPVACAGVAFSVAPTGEPTPLAEWVEGLGDRLVSGEAVATQRRLDAAACADDPMLAQLGELVRIARAYLDAEADIEWAYDGQTVWLLQLRPITQPGLRSVVDTQPVFEAAELYGEDEAPLLALGPLPEFASYFRRKRLPIARFARARGLASGAALVVRLNGHGLASAEAQARLAEAFTAPEIVADISDRIRQLIIPRERLLLELERLSTPAGEVRTIVLRDFVRGEAGIITQATQDARPVLMEWSHEGLLGMNRGTAASQVLALTEADLGSGPPILTEPNLRALYAGARDAAQRFGPVQIEWVVASGRLYPVDYSLLRGATAAVDADLSAISRGYAAGPVVVLDGGASLEAMSTAPSVSLSAVPDVAELGEELQAVAARLRSFPNPPIVVTPRPLAILASLLPFVSGFVFEAGSTLCHLAILLRERGLPAVQSPELYLFARSRRAVVLEVGGSVSLAEVAEPAVAANGAPA